MFELRGFINSRKWHLQIFYLIIWELSVYEMNAMLSGKLYARVNLFLLSFMTMMYDMGVISIFVNISRDSNKLIFIYWDIMRETNSEVNISQTFCVDKGFLFEFEYNLFYQRKTDDDRWMFRCFVWLFIYH